MGQFVGHEQIHVVVEERVVVDEARVGLRGRRGMLHPAGRVAGDGDLGVFRVRIAHPEGPGEQGQGARGGGEAPSRVRLAAFLAIVRDPDAFPVVADLGEPAHGQGDQVEGMRMVHAPMEGLPPALGPPLDEDSVGYGAIALGDADSQLGGGLLVGGVMAGEPAARVVGLSMAEKLGPAVARELGGRHKTQAEAGAREAVAHLQERLFTGEEAFGKRRLQDAVSVAEGDGPAPGARGGDAHLAGVQADAPGRTEGFQGEGAGPVDGAAAEIDR